jgi:O-methyltransferase involved in polyketide biosynthesis
MDNEILKNITNVSETLLIPLYSRAAESQTDHPLLKDHKAVEITKELNPFLKTSQSSLHQTLVKGNVRGKLGKKLHVTLALRTRRFDRYCISFLRKNPKGILIELGCGLSTRFPRIDNGTLTWYDLDFPEVINLRKQFFKESERYHCLASSVLDFSWTKMIHPRHNNILFIAEGLLMYLHEGDVKKLILTLQKTFPGCELVCEVVNTFVVRMLKRKLLRKKFQKDFHFGKDTSFYFGISDSRNLEGWNEGITFLDEWTYFDDQEKKLGWINIFAKSKKLRKTQWIVHYQLR